MARDRRRWTRWLSWSAAGAVVALAASLAAVPTEPAAAAPSRDSAADTGEVAPRGWVSWGDGSRRVVALSGKELGSGSRAGAVPVVVDPGVRGQAMDGFGAALTESSAHVLLGLSAERRRAALESLFDPVAGAGISVLRVPLGASDFALEHYTYDDVPAGQTDEQLAGFGLGRDAGGLAAVLGEALAVNPELAVMVSPWSAPAWMKTNGSLTGGGGLRPEYEGVYARYLVQAVLAWRELGVPVRWLTLQNEPGHAAADYPSMVMPVPQQARLAVAVRAGLDAAGLEAAGLEGVGVVGYDHNWDTPEYPDALLDDPAAAAALAGTAWHCYAGDPTAQTTLHDAHPQGSQWVSECSGLTSGSFTDDLEFASATLVVGAVRGWARSVLFWNLALDPTGGPHTGGCTNCRGVLTVDPASGTVTRNVEWDVLALTGRAVRPGAVRIGSTTDVSGIVTVAWHNPDGTTALYAYNGGSSARVLEVTGGTSVLRPRIPAGAAMSMVW